MDMEEQGTSYDEILNAFLFKVKAYELLMLAETEREEVIFNHFNSARSQFYRQCKSNLLDFDKNIRCFADELSIDEIDILAEIMVSKWLTPQMYSDELLESRLNTRDFSEYSPAKLIEMIHRVHQTSVKKAKQLIIDYSWLAGMEGGR
jgi:hypothetical protein